MSPKEVQRRTFLKTSTGLALSVCGGASPWPASASESADAAMCCRTYASPQDAIAAPREELAYVPAIYVGTENAQHPDYLATVDVDPRSPTYGSVVHRLAMPNVGDELHHFGWNACSSCHGQAGRHRRYIVLPGIGSGRIHIVDTVDPRAPTITQVIEADEIAEKTNLSAPHTVHCLADGTVMISMLGDAQGEGPGGFLLLDDAFNVKGRWERDNEGMQFNYDFWYQPRHNIMVSSEWGAPRTVAGGFQVEDVAAGKYGQRLHFWNWKERRIEQSIDLGDQGRIPLEVRFHHDPESSHGFVGAALGSAIWHWSHNGDAWKAQPVVQVDPVEQEGWPFPVPGLITDLVLSMDDRWLYFSNWLHGDIRQYDVRDPERPRLAGQVWLGGVIGHASSGPRGLQGGPQMLQLSLDGQRLYVTNSLYSPWDNQFYPEMAQRGSQMLQIECNTEQGGLQLAPNFYVDFGQEPLGPARAHEMRFPGGDCTSDIWI